MLYRIILHRGMYKFETTVGAANKKALNSFLKAYEPYDKKQIYKLVEEAAR